jgi:teichuronic acid exporter
MSLKQKTIQSLFWSALQNWGGQAGSLIVFLILARLLTPEAFGLLALSNVFINLMLILSEQALTAALIQRQELEPEYLDTAFWTVVVVSITLILIILTTAGLIADLFKQPQLELLLRVLSIVLLLNSLSSVQRAILRRKFDFKVLAVRSLVGIVICGVAGVIMALNGWGVWSLVGQQIIYEFIGVIVLWKVSDWRPRLQFSIQLFWQLYHFSIHLVAFQFLEFLNSRTDNLLVGYYFGERVLGYYAIAHRLLEVMIQLLGGTGNQVALSTFSRLQSERGRLRQAFYQVTQFISLIAFPTFLSVATLTPELILVMFGQKWQPSVPIFTVLTFAGIIRSFSLFNDSVLISLSKPDWRLRVSLLSACLHIMASLIAVRWGIIAVSMAYVLSDYVVFPVSLWVINLLINFSVLHYLKQLKVAAIATLLMVISIKIIKSVLEESNNDLLILATGIAIGAFVYSSVVCFLAPEIRKKVIELVKFIFSKKHKT